MLPLILMSSIDKTLPEGHRKLHWDVYPSIIVESMIWQRLRLELYCSCWWHAVSEILIAIMRHHQVRVVRIRLFSPI